jgi:hypothetical protein
MLGLLHGLRHDLFRLLEVGPQEPEKVVELPSETTSWAGKRDDVVNAEALACMRARHLAGEVIQKLDEHEQRISADPAAWSAHLDQLGVSKLDRQLARLHARQDEILRILDRPEIPLAPRTTSTEGRATAAFGT